MVLASFLVALALVLAAIAFCVVRGIQLWRAARSTGGAFGAEVARFEVRSARTERLLAENEAASKEVEAALERLRVSRAKLGVLTSEVGRAQARVRWLRAVLPV